MSPNYPANNRYKAKNCVRIALDVNRNTEPDLLEWLQGQENKSGYIKGLIRADMERQTKGGKGGGAQG